MQFNLLALLGISLAAMFFGYFFGLFEGRGQGYKKRKKDQELETSLQIAVERPVASPGGTEGQDKPVDRAASLLRLTFDEKNQLCLALDGDPVDTASLSPQQRKRLIELLVRMRPWVEAGPPQKQTPAALSPSAPLSGPQAPPVSPPSPSLRPAPLPSGVLESPAGTNITAALSLVAQIDAILQSKLLGTPLADRGIRLVESTTGGVTVVVGTNRYASVADVPDPEAQAAIRAATAEWEKRYTPG